MKSLKSGLTSRSLLGLIFVALVFQAPMVYYYLHTGDLAALVAFQWASIILVIEILRTFGRPLMKEEATVIFLGGWMATRFWFFTQYIYQLYVRYSPISRTLGIADLVPWFYAPENVSVWINRTFLDPSWIPVLAILLFTLFATHICDWLLGFIGYQLYYEVENLPFPTYRPMAEVVVTLTGRDEKRLGILSVIASVTFIYGIFLYGIRIVTSALWNTTGLTLITYPWIDFASYTQKVFPGASFGLPTELLFYAVGLIVPMKAAIGIFIGSFGLFFIGNHLLATYFSGQPWNIFSTEYTYGMSITDAWQRSVLYMWATPIIGISIAAGIVPLIVRPRVVVNAIRSLRRSEKEGYVPNLTYIILPYIALTSVMVILNYYLVPDFPIHTLIFLNMVWPFIYMLAASRGSAEAVDFTVPYFKESFILASGYQGSAAFFAPIYLPYSHMWVGHYSVCSMTGTKPLSYVLSVVAAMPVAFIMGFVLVQTFWSMFPMPSALFPGLQILWPFQLINQGIFISRGRFMRLEWLAGGFVVGAGGYILTYLLGWSSLIIGVAAGLAIAPPYSFAAFIGSIIGKLLTKKFGNEIRTYYPIIVAGVALGSGLAIGFGAALSIIIRGMWVKPY